MAVLTSDGATLRAFADSVLRAAEETLEEVMPVTLAVIGGVLAEAEPGSVALQDADDGFYGRLQCGSEGRLARVVLWSASRRSKASCRV